MWGRRQRLKEVAVVARQSSRQAGRQKGGVRACVCVRVCGVSVVCVCVRIKV